MNAEALPGVRGSVRLIKSARAPGLRTRILIVDRDPAAVAVVRSILRAQDWEVISAKGGAEAIEKARLEGPDAILTEMALADMAGPDLCRALRQRPETAATPIIVLSASSGVAERVASLRAGATDYMVKPPDAQELIARIKAALDLRKEKSGFVIAVVGGKGGVGASVLAVNLAVAIRRQVHGQVVLVDAARQGGTIDIMLNLQAGPSLGYVLGRLDELEDSELDGMLIPHASGLQVLLLNEQGGQDVRPEDLRKILVALRRTRDFVVVDLSAVQDEGTSTILDLADRVLLVLTPEITSLRGAKLLLERAGDIGLSRERIAPILNRFPQRGGLQRRDIENSVGVTVAINIPDDVKLVAYSINRGVPLMESHRRSGVARQVEALAKSLVKAAQSG